MTTTTQDSITIRRATEADAPALARLAALDAGRVPAGDLLLAEIDGQARVALSILTGEYVADPFHATRELVALLARRAARLRAVTVPRSTRIATRLTQWGELWRRAGELGRIQ